jgi:hypothetical protein
MTEREERVIDACRLLIDGLPIDGQRRVLQALNSYPRAGNVLGAIVQWMPLSSSWGVDQAKQAVAASGIEATPKEVYNALGYLTRKGRIRHLGYGQYIISEGSMGG